MLTYAKGNNDLKFTHKQIVDIVDGSKEDSIRDNLFTRLGIELHFFVATLWKKIRYSSCYMNNESNINNQC